MRMTVLAVAAVSVLVAAGCASRDDTQAADDGPTAPPEGGAGDFGDLEAVCGPGDARGPTARGVTDAAIAVSTMADPGATVAPGLGQEFFDAAEGFVAWCNEAGGILGRELQLTKRDSKLFEVGPRMIEACETDFALVGSGTPLDSAGVQPRVDCELPSFPGYVLSPQAIEAPLQIGIDLLPLDQFRVGLMRRLAEIDSEAWDHVAVVGSALANIRPYFLRVVEGIEATGGTVVAYDELPDQVDSYRPYAQRWKEAGVQVLYGRIFPEPMLQAAKEVGLEVKFLANDTSSYVTQVTDWALNADGPIPPFFVDVAHFPVELADDDPSGATAQAVEIIRAVDEDAIVGYQHFRAIAAWLAFATAARDCGSDLTTDCVLAGAQQDRWTAGGLFSPGRLATDIEEVTGEPVCLMVLELTTEGWVYNEEMTDPDEDLGFFNCDVENAITVDPHVE